MAIVYNRFVNACLGNVNRSPVKLTMIVAKEYLLSLDCVPYRIKIYMEFILAIWLG